jgi:hypothetical protein
LTRRLFIGSRATHFGKPNFLGAPAIAA